MPAVVPQVGVDLRNAECAFIVRTLRILALLIPALLLLVLSLTGCGGEIKRGEGVEEPSEIPGGVVAGRVTHSTTHAGLADVTVTFEPAVAERHFSVDLHPIMDKKDFKTDSTGFFYAKIPTGPYRLTFSKTQYRSATREVMVDAARKVTVDLALDSTAPVVVYAGEDLTEAAPGSTVSLRAAVFVKDGSILKGIRWAVQQQEGQVRVVISEEKGMDATVVLPDASTYKKALLDRLGRGGRLLNRWMVLGLRPFDLREAGKVTLVVRATTSSGTYTGTVAIFADLNAFAVANPGIQNVPIGEPVLLLGKNQRSYQWSLTGPVGSAAKLQDALTQTPHFAPDIPGVYVLAEGNENRLKIYAGTWNGIIAGQVIGKPWIGRKGCACHANDPIAGKFEAWLKSGHAEIFTQNVTTSYRYEQDCFPCHTVGFSKSSKGGIKGAAEYPAFLTDATLWDLGKIPPISKPAAKNWVYILNTYPGVAQLTNAQCENCHGPHNSEAHRTLKITRAPERINLSADVCGVCHDESVDVSSREWQDSRHSNYNLAVEVATVERRGGSAGDCARCHAGQGFLAWMSQRDRRQLQGKEGDASPVELSALGLTIEKVHPLTCAICHEPHNVGNSFRSRTEKVPVRISDDGQMRPTEFGGERGGRGALCLLCHSTASGPYNDTALRLLSSDWAPHAAQGDVLMGQNAFFVEVGKSKSHSSIEDTCIECHLKPVPKKSALGYPRGGVNHTFKAQQNLCSRCHKDFEGKELMSSMHRDIEKLKAMIEAAIVANIKSKKTVRLVKVVKGTDDRTLNAQVIRKLELVDHRNEIALEVTTRQEVYRVPLSRVHPGGTPFLPTGNGQVIAKAAWNYLLIKSDASRGAHNPQFVSEVLEATLAKLKSLKF